MEVRYKKNENQNHRHFHNFIDAKIVSQKNMFDFSSVPEDAKNIIDNFDDIVQSVRPLNAKQFRLLPKNILSLSHQLTDERNERRKSYMNSAEELSAYTRYFSWWNIVRFTRIFSNLQNERKIITGNKTVENGKNANAISTENSARNVFELNDGDVCLDIGSGPLTTVISLWLSCPRLRNKRLTFYCVDLSMSSLTLGENLYLAIASKIPPTDKNAPPHWKIVRVKGSVGVHIKQKAAFVSATNMFNEIREIAQKTSEEIADAYFQKIKNYATENATFFIAEPGMPIAAHFVSLMRDKFLKNGFSVALPCPHTEKCPMSGKGARFGGNVKWCNFAFSTVDVPEKLLKLSEKSSLPKERAVTSFVIASRKKGNEISGELQQVGGRTVTKLPTANCQLSTVLRIASDPINLPCRGEAFYACSKFGLTLLVNTTHKKIASGDEIALEMKTEVSKLEKDKKTGAVMIRI